MHYSLTIEADDTYKIWGRVITPTKQDVFALAPDRRRRWWAWDNVPLGSSWHWDDVHANDPARARQFALKAGSHTLDVAYREDGVRLDKLLITNALGFVPYGQGG